MCSVGLGTSSMPFEALGFDLCIQFIGGLEHWQHWLPDIFVMFMTEITIACFDSEILCMVFKAPTTSDYPKFILDTRWGRSRGSFETDLGELQLSP